MSLREESPLIHSPLQQVCKVAGKSIDIPIYRLQHTDWTLEVVDVAGRTRLKEAA